jgi:hypothetical protein
MLLRYVIIPDKHVFFVIFKQNFMDIRKLPKTGTMYIYSSLAALFCEQKSKRTPFENFIVQNSTWKGYLFFSLLNNIHPGDYI